VDVGTQVSYKKLQGNVGSQTVNLGVDFSVQFGVPLVDVGDQVAPVENVGEQDGIDVSIPNG
jgi:hypothetical protein